MTEILPQRDVIFEAIGGDGEPGRRGGDGQSGRDGRPGIDATKVQDATPGTDGGNGGAAGNGSSGADGGQGGEIRIYVDEDHTHLLLMTSWDVKGGRGGAAGEHGMPGLGGKGGAGGQKFTWEEQNGYQYRCTPNCAGRTTVPESNLRTLSRHDPRLALVSGIGSQVAAGSTMQTAIVKLAQYRANTRRKWALYCCDAIPVYQTKTRVAAIDGNDGLRGDTPFLTLFSGQDGRSGSAMIIVTSKTGREQTFRSCYQLELVDFDVEEENEDGIFEPGQHLFIRRIRVKNTVVGNEGKALIPPVLAGQTVTLPGSIKVKIREPDHRKLGSSSFQRETIIGLKATMPGLNRRLKHFDYSTSVNIQYPLELQSPDFLRTMVQGFGNKISMKIQNKSSQRIGGKNMRKAEIRISIPAETGSLRASPATWTSQVTRECNPIDPGGSSEIVQTTRISLNAKDHSYAKIRVEFYLSSPIATFAPPRSSTDLVQRLIQSLDLSIQIAATHAYNDRAEILLVTNEKTSEDRFHALDRFISQDLGLKMDRWNVSLYGGLTSQDESSSESEEATMNILRKYRGRTIVFLGNEFEHFGLKKQTIIDLCDSRIVAEECFMGTTCVILGATAPRAAREAWLNSAIFPVSDMVSNVPVLATESSTFNNKVTLEKSICEQIIGDTTRPQAYKLESIPKWYFGGGKMTVRCDSKQIRNHLRQKLPRERFLICAVPPQTGTSARSGYVAIWHGVPSRGTLFATESKEVLKLVGQEPQLHQHDCYAIVCSLPCSLRISKLCSLQIDTLPDQSEKDNGRGSSVSGEDAQEFLFNVLQYSLEETVTTEIEEYLQQSPIMNNITLGAQDDPCGDFRLHLRCLQIILQHIAGLDIIPERASAVLQVAMIATHPQNKRQLFRSFLFPFGQRRAQLQAFLQRQIDQIYEAKGISNATFWTGAQARYSRFDSKKRNIMKVIEEQNRKFTKLSTHQYKNGRYTTQSLIPHTQICTEIEWDGRFRESQSERKKLEKNTKMSLRKREGMSSMQLSDVPEMA